MCNTQNIKNCVKYTKNKYTQNCVKNYTKNKTV